MYSLKKIFRLQLIQLIGLHWDSCVVGVSLFRLWRDNTLFQVRQVEDGSAQCERTICGEGIGRKEAGSVPSSITVLANVMDRNWFWYVFHVKIYLLAPKIIMFILYTSFCMFITYCISFRVDLNVFSSIGIYCFVNIISFSEDFFVNIITGEHRINWHVFGVDNILPDPIDPLITN